MTKVNYKGMTVAQMKRAEAAHTALFEATTKVDGFFIADLRTAFGKVHNDGDWKAPVDTIITVYMLAEWEAEGITVEMIDAGITFFQGCVAKVKPGPTSDCIHIVSPGYVC